MDEVAKPKQARKTSRTILPAVDRETAMKHLLAYSYIAYSNCNCEACVLLRPIALKMVESVKKGKIGGEMGVGEERSEG
ncbi:MAG: hypothetical protein QXI11_02010 [Thermoproteota archaeon]